MNESNHWNAASYNTHVSFVSNLALPVVELLDARKNEKILDLGCGDGTLAIEIKKSNAKVIGVDLSQSMVDKSNEKGIEAYVKDVANLGYKDEFDAVFSNAMLHWVKDGKNAVKNIHLALKKEGRFIAEFGGYGNVNHILNVISEVFNNNKEYGKFNNPWYFPTKEEYKKLLENSGFRVEYIELIQRPTPIEDVSHWFDIFANGILFHLNTKQQMDFKEEAREILKSKIFTQKDGWVVDYVRLRFKAVKV